MEKQTAYWASNLKFLRKRKGLSQEALAENLGISRAKLNAQESGATVNPPVDDLLHFSAYFKMSVDALLKENLAGLSELKVRELEAGNDAYARGTAIRVLATTVSANNEDNAEFVPVKAKAGYTAGYGDPEFIASLPQFSLPLLPGDRKHRMFPTEGDSMRPVPDGAYVVGEFVQDWKALKAQTPCVVVTRESGIVFKLVTPKETAENSLLLESINPAYDEYEVAAEEVLEVWKFACYVSRDIPADDVSLLHIGADVRDMKRDLAWLVSRNRQ